jgi:hypothetical protein
MRAHVFLGPDPRKIEILGPSPARTREKKLFRPQLGPGSGHARSSLEWDHQQLTQLLLM